MPIRSATLNGPWEGVWIAAAITTRGETEGSLQHTVRGPVVSLKLPADVIHVLEDLEANLEAQ